MSFRNEFLRGLRPGILIALAVTPFGLLYGILAVDNGLTVTEAMLMSIFIYGGASQMVGIDLFGQKVAPWLIILSIFAVNFRFVLYSAAVGRRLEHWRPWQRALGFFILTDAQFAECEAKYERRETIGFAWYLGLGLPMYVLWNIETWLGGMFGRLIPDSSAWGFDVMLTIYFFCLVMGFRRRSMWLPVVTLSGAVAVVIWHTIGSPWHITAGAFAGVALAAIFAPKRMRPAAEAVS